MVFEIVFSSEKGENGFSSYLKSLTSEVGVQVIEQFPSVVVLEGEWEPAMSFLRHCTDYLREHERHTPVTTVHIHQ